MNKKLVFKHLKKSGTEGAPLKELHQVLPGHSRGQIQVLLRELRNEGRVYVEGNTSAAKWFASTK
jgi:ATP-dependent DNA helicase RecG